MEKSLWMAGKLSWTTLVKHQKKKNAYGDKMYCLSDKGGLWKAANGFRLWTKELILIYI